MQQLRVLLWVAVCSVFVLTAEVRSDPLPQAQDVSDQLNAMIARAEFPTPQARMASQFRYLLVPGFFSAVMQSYFSFVTNYFEEFATLLAEMGASCEIVRVNSQEGPDANRSVIRAAIEKDERPAIIIGHSYGSIYSISTLLHFPDLQHRIGGIIAIQSPFHGAKLTRYLDESQLLRLFVNIGVHVFGGSEKSLKSLSEEYRLGHLQKWKQPLNELFDAVPTLTIASKIQTHPVLRWLWPSDEDIDGLVETASSRLPFAQTSHAILEDWDHLDTVTFNPLRWGLGLEQKERRPLLQSALMIILKLIARKEMTAP